MNVSIRAALAALLLPAALLPVTPSFAACSIDLPVCVDDLVEIGEVGGTGGGGDGVLCGYVKTAYPPPSDWPQDRQNEEGPYAFTRTQAWGDSYQHRKGHDWDARACAPACPIGVPDASASLSECLPEIG